VGGRVTTRYSAILVNLALLGSLSSVFAASLGPSISGTPSPAVNVGQGYAFAPTVTAPNVGELKFSIANMPRWAQFDSATGVLFGTPQAGDEGSYTDILISVSSDGLTDTLPVFSVTVNQVSPGSVTLNWISPSQNTDSSTLTNLAGFKIYFGTSLGSYSNTVLIDNPGITTFVVENLAPNTWYFVLTAYDQWGKESDFSNVVTKVIEEP
jgi:hypothetical protein